MIRQDRVAGIWQTFEDALKAGYKEFGLEPFMVKQIHAIEPVHHYTHRVAAAMPNLTLPLADDGPLVDVVFMASNARGRDPEIDRTAVPEAGADDRLDRYPGPAYRPWMVTSSGRLSASRRSARQTSIPLPMDSPRKCDLFDICFSFSSPPTPMRDDMPIIEGVFTGKRYNALIGRDILRRCLLFYNGPDDTFTLAF